MIQSVRQPPTEAEYMEVLNRTARRLARKLPDRIQAEDLVQFGWFGIYSILRKFHTIEIRDVNALLSTAARRAMLNGLYRSRELQPKGAKHRPLMLSLDAALSGSEDDDLSLAAVLADDVAYPESGLQQRGTVQQVLSILDPRSQRLLRLRYVESLSMEQAALVLNISIHKAQQIHAAAMNAIRNKFQLSEVDDG